MERCKFAKSQANEGTTVCQVLAHSFPAAPEELLNRLSWCQYIAAGTILDKAHAVDEIPAEQNHAVTPWCR
jgi:hypothetical protein